MSLSEARQEASAGVIAIAALATARRFNAGATMWCLAPSAAHHSAHVAVEFVHPVIVGKRALPAAALPTTSIDDARLLTNAGDILLVIGQAADESLMELMRRGAPWDVLTLFVCEGSVTTPGMADYVIEVESVDDGAMLAYHLLWELIHVALEHPGLLQEPQCTDEVCITCSDEGRVVEVQSVADGSTVVALDRGLSSVIDTTVIADVECGDLLLVHAGVALAIVGGAMS